ncbi:MAG TPA: protoglobin domain-containing protein [Anaeromyxobacter sp.]|nr:protoglobin domain-containing protein [Anaeromyxobacter sp.]
MAETSVAELERYVGFSEADQALLRELHAAAATHLAAVATVFYERILEHPQARQVLEGGERRVGHLRITLTAWLDSLLQGPWDDGYWRGRARIGRIHVRIGLPQDYMFGAMNVLRAELDRLARDSFAADPEKLHRVHDALGKILDLELAAMLRTYRDDLLAQRARAERLSTFGQLVGSIGHELRNPLAVIEASLHLLRARLGGEEATRRQLDRIGQQVGVASGIITNLLDMIRDRPPSRERVELAPLVEGAAASLQRPREVTLELVGLHELPAVQGDPVQLRQVFANLLENAVFAASPAGTVWVRGRLTEAGVSLDVEDSGPGVDAATLRHLFHPLVTTKDGGVGLGLALVKRIAERHGGSVAYADRPGGGARFTVALPGSSPHPADRPG